MKRILLTLLLVSVFWGLKAQIYATVDQLRSNSSNNGTQHKRKYNLADSGLFSTYNNGSYEPTVLRIYSYDVFNNFDSVLEKNPNTGELINNVEYKYDAKGKKILVYTENYSTGSKLPFSRETYHFDSLGNRTFSMTEQYQSNNQTWVVLFGDSFDFTYDSKARITDYTMYQISNQGISPYQKLIWEDFDQNDLPQILTVQTFANGFNNYIKLEKMKWLSGYDYAEFDPSSYFGYVWNGSTQHWIASAYDTSIYSGNNRILKLLFSWNGSTIDSLAKTEYRYDTKGHRLESMSYNRTGQSWSISDGRRDSIVYGFDDVILERFYSYYDNSTFHWINQEKEKYYFNSLSNQSIQRGDLKIYPNPAKDHLFLSNAPFEITKAEAMSIEGKKFPLKIVGERIQISELIKGVYLLKLETDYGIWSTRVVVN